MSLEKIIFKQFTAFNSLEIDFCPGINIFIGANSTGKTHILKTAYAACEILTTKISFAEKLSSVFLPYQNNFGRLAKRKSASTKSSINVRGFDTHINLSFSNHTKTAEKVDIKNLSNWSKAEARSVFIPVKEMLANAPGFRSLYTQRDIHFDATYADIIDRAYLPGLRGPISRERKQLLKMLEGAISGKVTNKDEVFFLKSKEGNLEFSLLSEGVRKLCLIWLLIQNGTLENGSVLFWDEPETNLNPNIQKELVSILLTLARLGTQIHLATHNYALLKEFQIQANQDDLIMYNSLYKGENDCIEIQQSKRLDDLEQNPILKTYEEFFDREIEKSFGGKPV